MSDKKISALTAAATPLAGTEVLPIVQSGVTKKVATLDVTGGVYIGKGASNIASNTVVGNLAGAAITTASNSVAIGNATSALLTTGIQNTSVGDQALYSNVTGNYNAAFGRATLGLATGSQNSGFGWNAGSSLTTGANNAFWGHNAQPSAASVSNEYTYGNSAVTKHRFVGGDIVIGTAGKGIDFSADGQAAGMTSELLDDYEEGTWSPSVGGDATYLIQTGFYTKIGRQVTVTAKLQINVLGTGSVNLISGLPFTAGNFGFQAGSVFYYSGSVSNVTMLGIATDGNSATFKISYSTGNVLTTLLAPTLFQNSTRIDFSATYQI